MLSPGKDSNKPLLSRSPEETSEAGTELDEEREKLDKLLDERGGEENARETEGGTTPRIKGEKRREDGKEDEKEGERDEMEMRERNIEEDNDDDVAVEILKDMWPKFENSEVYHPRVPVTIKRQQPEDARTDMGENAVLHVEPLPDYPSYNSSEEDLSVSDRDDTFQGDFPTLANASTGIFARRAFVEKQMAIPEKSEKNVLSAAPSAFEYEYGMDVMATFRDDEEMMQRIIQEMGFVDRILDAVEYNSLRCLELLLNCYEKQHTTLYLKIRRRNLSMNWPLSARPLEHPLHLVASRKSSLDAIKHFDRSENFMSQYVDVIDSNFLTPLHIAVQRSNTRAALFLIKHGARPDSLDESFHQNSPIKLAALNGCSQILDAILERYLTTRANLLTDDDLYGQGHTIFYWAVKSGDLDTVRCLLEKCKDEDLGEMVRKEIEHETDSGEFVCNVWSLNFANLLKDFLEGHEGALRKRDNNQATPLMRAAERDQLEVVQDILRTPCGKESLRDVDKNQRNVFHYAYKHEHILNELLAHAWRDLINAADSTNTTALKLAADEGCNDCFKILLRCVEKGKESDLFHHPYVGFTSFEILKIIVNYWRSDQPETLEKLITGADNFPPPLIGATVKGDLDIIKYLLNIGANGQQLGFDDNTVLHYAASCDARTEVLQYLITTFPTLLDLTNDCGQTAIGCATEAGNKKVVRFLLQHHARLTGDSPGGNVFDCAFGNFEKEGVEDALKEILVYCDENQDKTTLKQIMANSCFGPDALLAKFVEDCPKIAIEVLNRCKEHQTALRNARSGEIRSERNDCYHFYAIKGDGEGNLQAITSMMDNNRDECLAHPVTSTFLDLKLSSRGVSLWLNINLLIYVIFLVSLTTYIGLQTSGSYQLDSAGMVTLSIIILILCILSLIKEIFQLVSNPKVYLIEISNYMEIVTYTCSIIYVVTPVEDYKTHHQIKAGAIAILFAWFNFIWSLRRFKLLGLRVIMMHRVLISVVKILPIAVLFITAYGLSFMMLMSEDPDNAFRTIPYSLLTTTIMISGEIDYRDVFLEDSPFGDLQKVLLVTFVVVLVIVLMNLLVGIAVDDIGAIAKRSEAESQLNKAKLVVALEKLLHPSWCNVPLLVLLVPDPYSNPRFDEDDVTFSPVRVLKNVYKQIHGINEEKEVEEEDSEGRIENIQRQLNHLCEIQKTNEEIRRKDMKKIEEQMEQLLHGIRR